MKTRNFLLRIALYSIALLPFGVQYLFSNILFVIIYYLVRYRRKTVKENLTGAFPQLNRAEIRKISKQFYHNLCDLIVEVIKSQTMSQEQIHKRVEFTSTELFDEYYRKEKNIIVLLGHCGNWEWVGNKIALFLKHEGAAVYKPLKDKFFEDYLVKQRQKYKNTLMIDYKKVLRKLISLSDRLVTVFVLADQSPALHEMDYFVKFLGRKTAFYDGIEKVARALGYAVFYLDVTRKKRGYYNVNVRVLSSDASKTTEGEITNQYVRALEETIINQPDNWLWSHKRWKGVEEGNQK